MEAHSEKPTPVWTGPLSQHVGRHVQQRTVPMGIILRHETVQETGIFNHGNLSQHVGGHGRQTMVLMPIRHVQYAAEPFRIRTNLDETADLTSLMQQA